MTVTACQWCQHWDHAHGTERLRAMKGVNKPRAETSVAQIWIWTRAALQSRDIFEGLFSLSKYPEPGHASDWTPPDALGQTSVRVLMSLISPHWPLCLCPTAPTRPRMTTNMSLRITAVGALALAIVSGIHHHHYVLIFMHLFPYSYLAWKLIALWIELLQSILNERKKVHRNFKI